MDPAPVAGVLNRMTLDWAVTQNQEHPYYALINNWQMYDPVYKTNIPLSILSIQVPHSNRISP